MEEIFGVSSLASLRNDVYAGTQVVVTACARSQSLGFKDGIAYDTSDGKHWFGVEGLLNADMEALVSLVDMRIEWSPSHGFRYSGWNWVPEERKFVEVHLQPIPWAG